MLLLVGTSSSEKGTGNPRRSRETVLSISGYSRHLICRSQICSRKRMNLGLVNAAQRYQICNEQRRFSSVSELEHAEQNPRHHLTPHEILHPPHHKIVAREYNTASQRIRP